MFASPVPLAKNALTVVLGASGDARGVTDVGVSLDDCVTPTASDEMASITKARLGIKKPYRWR
jgi:hypothetical protein